MYIDLEIIFNNTYGYIQFTYKVPNDYAGKISVGDIVEVPFRNVIRHAIVLEIESKGKQLQNIKSVIRKIGHIDNSQLKYLEKLAISNNINIGMLLHRYINYLQLSKQKVVKNHIASVNKNSDLHLKLKDSNNIIFVSSLLEAKDTAKRVTQMGKHVDFYQKTGGVKEFNAYWKSVKKFENIILLSVNFEKIIINNTLKFHFYNSNNYSFNLPTLNNINIIESSIIKSKIFKGNFFYYSEFPSLDFFNDVKNYFIDIPVIDFTYIYGNNLQDCLQLFDRKFVNTELKLFTFNSEIQTFSRNHRVTNDINEEDIDAVIIFNPTISHNGVLSSTRLINFIKNIDYFSKKDKEIIIFSTTKIDLNNQLTEEKINSWANKEKQERSKYGPNINIKIFKITSNVEIEISNYSKYLIGPKISDDKFEYELKIQINKKYNYNEVMSIYSIFKRAQFDRVKSL